jgi:hypothetical protein
MSKKAGLLICVTYEIKFLGLLSHQIAYLISRVGESVSPECKVASTLATGHTLVAITQWLPTNLYSFNWNLHLLFHAKMLYLLYRYLKIFCVGMKYSVYCGIQDRGLMGRFPEGVEFIHVSKIYRTSLDPPSLPLNGWKISVSPRARLPELEANHSLPSNTEVKNKKSHTSAVPIRLLGMISKNFTYKCFTTHICETTEVWGVLRDVTSCGFVCVIIRKLDQKIRVLEVSRFI